MFRNWDNIFFNVFFFFLQRLVFLASLLATPVRCEKGPWEKGPSSRGVAHVVAAALPKFPICALKLGDRTSPTSVVRGLSTGLRRTRTVGATASPVPLRGLMQPERLP